MRIGINATCLNDRPSGAKQRFIGIYGSLFKLLEDTEFLIYEPSDCHVGKWFNGQVNVSAKPTSIPSVGRWTKLLASTYFWSKEFSKENFGLFDAMHLPLFHPQKAKVILTIHDIRDLYPQHSSMNRFVYQSVLRHALSCANHVVTVSAAMREEILDFYPHPSVSVIYNGFDSGVFLSFTQEDGESFLAKYKLPRDFVLAVGHYEKRKNYSCLVDAIALLKKQGFNCPLVIIGNDSGEMSALSMQIESLGLLSQVHLLTGLSDFEVRCAYLMSSLFVFPSSYEGFGIPILEAMAAGKPMVLSNLPVFREITKDQSIYFSPESIEEMASALKTGLSSTELRLKMVDFGRKRVNDFRFDSIAQDLKEVYLKCL